VATDEGAENYGESLNVDNFEYTSPVGSFATNQHVLHNLGGNVYEWCEDKWNSTSFARVLCGSSWINSHPDNLLSSCRSISPGDRDGIFSFRCVLASGSGG
jgi:formylglycine-generating enzyme required for sulfatase activity